MSLLLLGPEGPTPLEAGDTPPVGVLADGVVAHRVRLAATGARARAAEAEALAAELAATPPEATHVALGPVAPDGEAWLAIADPEAVEAALAAAPAPPARLVPAALLLPPPPPGGTSAARLGDRVLLRTETLAATLPAAAAEALLPDAAGAPPLAGLPLDDAGLDLLQGRFAPRRPFWQAPGFRPAAALLAGLALLLALVPPVAERLRAAAAARLADEATVAIAARVAGQPFDSAEAAAAAVARLRTERGVPELAPRLAHLMAALEPEPGVRLARLAFTATDGLAATLAGEAAPINAVAARLARGPFAFVQQGDVMRLGAPRPAAPEGTPPAFARLAEVRRDAEGLAAVRPRPPGPAGPALARLLAETGVADPTVEPRADGTATARLPAIRAGLLLPLLARAEAEGLALVRVEVRRNADSTLAADLEVR